MNHTLTQKAYEHIHSKLSAGQLQPGSRLSNRGVAKEVGVSFTPVREALSRLVSEGLLEYRQGLGVFVPTSNIQEIREIFELREILESEAVARLCGKLPSKTLAEIIEIHECMSKTLSIMEDAGSEAEAAQKVSNWQAANKTFHRTLLCAKGNRRLLDTVEGLWTSLDVMIGGMHKLLGQLEHQLPSESQSLYPTYPRRTRLHH